MVGFRAVAALGCALFLAAGCGSKVAPGSSDGGGNGLAGAGSFPVSFETIDPILPKEQCGETTSLPGGGYAAFALYLSDFDLVDDAGLPVNVAPPGAHVLRVELAGPSYTGGMALTDGGSPAPVTPGTYAVAFEGEDDDDLCMLTPGTSAILDLFDFSDDGSFTQSTAASGTITITSIATGRIQGSFQVALSRSPFQVTEPTTPLAGSFDARGM